MALPTLPLPALVSMLHCHLQEVRDNPTEVLNEKLLEEFNSQSSRKIEESSRDALLDQLSDLLPTLQQDPTPVTNLINVLVLPDYGFTRVLAIHPPVDFTAGLSSTIPSINLTVLSLLEEALYRKSDIDIVAGKADVVAALIKLWLCTPDTAVAGRAHDVIRGLLKGGMSADGGENTLSDSGFLKENLMWRRILRDRDIYGSIFSICSLSTAGQEGSLSRREKTLSQARLLEMLLKIDSGPVRTSQIPDIEERFGVKNGGLLQFAAIHMVDYRDDVLMHITLIDFYANYLKTGHEFALNFMRSNGLHNRSMAYYLEPEQQDPMDLAYLNGTSAGYISAYCLTYPQDLLLSPVAVKILARVTQEIENTSSSQWAQAKGPQHGLLVLVSLPRVMLVHGTEASSPLFSIPVKHASSDAFVTLATIFNGCQRDVPENQAAARALYFLEMENFPNFWECVVAAANTVALKESALQALGLIEAVISASWSPLTDLEPPRSALFKLPSERELASRCHVESLPRSGIEAIMTQPALGIVVPYLMRPAQSFSSLVGGGRGDVESAVYMIAAAKLDVLTRFHQKLKEWVKARGEGQEMVAAVGRRVAQGAMESMSEAGGHVGTMEL